MVRLVSPADKVTEYDFQRKFAAWKRSLAAAGRERNSAGDPKKREEAAQRHQILYNQRSEFMKDDCTGFVWLYLRK
jgi:hypothetical protein